MIFLLDLLKLIMNKGQIGKFYSEYPEVHLYFSFGGLPLSMH